VHVGRAAQRLAQVARLDEQHEVAHAPLRARIAHALGIVEQRRAGCAHAVHRPPAAERPLELHRRAVGGRQHRGLDVAVADEADGVGVRHEVALGGEAGVVRAQPLRVAHVPAGRHLPAVVRRVDEDLRVGVVAEDGRRRHRQQPQQPLEEQQRGEHAEQAMSERAQHRGPRS